MVKPLIITLLLKVSHAFIYFLLEIISVLLKNYLPRFEQSEFRNQRYPTTLIHVEYLYVHS